MSILIDRDADECIEFTLTPVRGIAEARRLGRAFIAATHGGFGSAFAELHAAVEAFVEPERDSGEPPERVIIALKNALAVYGGLQAQSAPTGESTIADRGEVYDRVFRWTVDAYYDKG